jgi:hypothetical protein
MGVSENAESNFRAGDHITAYTRHAEAEKLFSGLHTQRLEEK